VSDSRTSPRTASPPAPLSAVFDAGQLTSDGGSSGWPRRTPAWLCPAPSRRRSRTDGAARVQLDTLRLCLVKIGGWVREARHQLSVTVHLASSHPGEPLWRPPSAHFKLHE
jgi:hypothetical protein